MKLKTLMFDLAAYPGLRRRRYYWIEKREGQCCRRSLMACVMSVEEAQD
jgi:hypothetical protein